MSISFQDIRLKEAQKTFKKDQLLICANVVSEYCQEVFQSFEKETGLIAKEHCLDLSQTDLFNKYFKRVSPTTASIYYVVRKKSFFKDAIVLTGEISFLPNNYAYMRMENSSEDPSRYIDQFISLISSELALLKQGS